jgi:POT family proton-dependent oligopeptide transporter
MKASRTPNDLLPVTNQVGCIFPGPDIQGSLYPFLHRQQMYLNPIVRIIIGCGLFALFMLYAAIFQHSIYSAPPC